MTPSRVRRALCVTALGLVSATVSAQPSVRWSGEGFLDYLYVLGSDSDAAVGSNTFDYRRIRLTSDIRLDDQFSARIRYEGESDQTTEQGRPAPFIKDAYVRWAYSEAGHRATLGVVPPPVFRISEAVWGYRSLDKTIVDRTRLRSSRDFGLRLDGPIGGGGLRYSAMVGNGNGVGPEDDGARGKRVYGRLSYVPDSPLRVTVNGDYASVDPDAEVRQSSVRGSAFVGAVTERVRGGVEAFYVVNDPEGAALDRQDGVGVSVFGAVTVAPQIAVVARYDYVDDDAGRVGEDEHYVLGALAISPSEHVRLMPNVLLTKPDGADPEVLGRFTAEFRF